MPIGIALYAWYMARAFSIYMVYRSIRTKSFGCRAIYIYHVYRHALYPMFSYVHSMFSYVYPHPSQLFGSLPRLHPASPPECGALDARLNAFKLLQQQDTPGQA